MSSNLQDILNQKIAEPPKGWKAGLEFDGEGGEATSRPLLASSEYDPDETLRDAGLDPEMFEVSNFRFSTWDAQTKAGIETFRSYKFSFRKKAGADEESVDIEELVDVISGWEPGSDLDGPSGKFGPSVFAVGDLQLGKGDGDGSDGIVRRYMQALEAGIERWASSDADSKELLIAFLGDCIEGVVSQGGRNIGNNDLTLTEQLRVLRHLMTQTVARFADAGAVVTVASVPGNHDETHRAPVNAKPHDSFAVDSLRAVEEAFTLAGRDDVTFLYPKESELAIAATVGGVGFLMAHGHQWRTGKHYQWWQGQAFSAQTGHDAQWLLAGHRHHLFLDTESDRYFLQVPALEQRSDWWRNKTGQVGNPGAVYLEVEPDGAPRVIALVQ